MAQNIPEPNYLYDFIYLDRPRIASYFAQLFEENGVLTGLKTTSQRSTQFGYKAKAGVPSVVGGEAAGNDSEAQSLERQFDTAWTLPINVLGGLKDAGYIHEELASTPIGQLVHIKGSLRIMDVRIMKELWSSAFSMLTAAENPTTSAQRKKLNEQKQMINTFSGFISKMPHALQMSFTTDGNEAWSTLSTEHVTINSEDFALKHGANIQGDWHLVGIVDAVPDVINTDFPDTEGLEHVMLTMLGAVRNGFGRPADAYGVTPIAIYRSMISRD